MTRLFSLPLKVSSLLGHLLFFIGLNMPHASAIRSYTIEMDESDDNYTRTFALYFSDPSQVDITASSFKVDTRLASLLVASEECLNDKCIPVYNSETSPTASFSRNIPFAPWKATGQDLVFQGRLVTDTVCLFENETCAEKVGFLAMGDDWTYHNILGIAPKSLTLGPVLI